ncbi:protein-L-isoaspartate(D-aspartate) O-methyltransferase [Lignipirellula cremea]|uniref:Protein-L-isoaspartate O-methyltransferase n=1 Tax=Lignipirellula cremea TaxID=2528010 RepID=A0A518DTH7_9BACT|nr:protein-L-isoaspartate(D-aspartate) O-methyltransferase [Lignipirellula cremea]QDU95145.1 Protein-L-isoaspartate O-methyltransferase [Lignipirellula cremea]
MNRSCELCPPVRRQGTFLPAFFRGVTAASLLCIAAFCVVEFGATVSTAQAQTRFGLEAARQRMVDDAIAGAGVKDPRVLKAMLDTPRHEFVRSSLRSQAYYDMALPIGEQQTISSPFIVAYMTESIDPQPNDRVLEIGTGSGYQAAVLSPLVKEVYSIEIVEELGKMAARTLSRLSYQNVFTKVGDGFLGWPDKAPFDKIIVTCSPEKIPVPLVEQLKEGGLMVIPVGERYQQTLYLMRKTDGKLVAEKLRPTLFVPMTGAAEDARQVKPDPLHPAAENPGFEEELPENGFVPGWYYQRQLTFETGNAPVGNHYVTFRNSTAGRHAHLLQGFAIDGRSVQELRLSGWVRCQNVTPGRSNEEVPLIAVSFFDEQRKDLGVAVVGPFRGTSDWRLVERTVRVPPNAREGILRIGLFGAVGEISFDEIQMTKAR